MFSKINQVIIPLSVCAPTFCGHVSLLQTRLKPCSLCLICNVVYKFCGLPHSYAISLPATSRLAFVTRPVHCAAGTLTGRQRSVVVPGDHIHSQPCTHTDSACIPTFNNGRLRTGRGTHVRPTLVLGVHLIVDPTSRVMRERVCPAESFQDAGTATSFVRTSDASISGIVTNLGKGLNIDLPMA